MTIEDNHLDYYRKTKTPIADLITLKLLLNSALSRLKANFMKVDIKNFYLETYFNNEQYIFLPSDLIPNEIMTTYNLQHNIRHGKSAYSLIKVFGA